MSDEQTRWIAVDWGTSRLRCWAMAEDNQALAHVSSGAGMASLASGGADFESALLDLIQPWLRDGVTVPVHACGMVGARQGWLEVPYDPAPCPPQTTVAIAPARSPAIEVFIHAGVSQESPPDVMRGEETQVAGLLATKPDFEGLVCLPGTHSKWVEVADGEIKRFQTFLTGEIFALLAEHSILRHTVAEEGWNEDAFLEALRDALADPRQMPARCFGLRAEFLLHGLDGVAARSRLSGILVGHELAGALAVHPGTRDVALIGEPPLLDIYRSALHAAGIATTTHSAVDAVLAGLAAARASQ